MQLLTGKYLLHHTIVRYTPVCFVYITRLLNYLVLTMHFTNVQKHDELVKHAILVLLPP